MYLDYVRFGSESMFNNNNILCHDSMYHYLFEVTQPVITLLIDLFSEYLMNDLIGFYNMN